MSLRNPSPWSSSSFSSMYQPSMYGSNGRRYSSGFYQDTSISHSQSQNHQRHSHSFSSNGMPYLFISIHNNLILTIFFINKLLLSKVRSIQTIVFQNTCIFNLLSALLIPQVGLPCIRYKNRVVLDSPKGRVMLTCYSLRYESFP